MGRKDVFLKLRIGSGCSCRLRSRDCRGGFRLLSARHSAQISYSILGNNSGLISAQQPSITHAHFSAHLLPARSRWTLQWAIVVMGLSRRAGDGLKVALLCSRVFNVSSEHFHIRGLRRCATLRSHTAIYRILYHGHHELPSCVGSLGGRL